MHIYNIEEKININSQMTNTTLENVYIKMKIETCASGLITLNEMTYTISEEDGTFLLELTGVSDNVNNIVSFIGNLENQEITYKNNGYYLAGDKYEFSVICILESDIVQK